MKMTLETMDFAITSLSEINEDNSVPRNVRTQIQNIITTLKQEVEVPMRINKALNVLDEISSDVNLQAYTRTQLWNIMSVLEKL